MYIRRIFKRTTHFTILCSSAYHIILVFQLPALVLEILRQHDIIENAVHLCDTWVTAGSHFPVNDQVTVFPEALLLSQLPS